MGRKRGVVILSAALAVMLLVSCGKKEEKSGDGYIEEESIPYEQLSKSSAAKFSNEDLTFDGARMGMTPDEVKKILGEPDEDRTAAAEANPERIFVYNGENGKSTLFFWNAGGVMKLCGVECTDPLRNIARNTKVGMDMDSVRDVFYRDENALNANIMSEDNATILGKFLYGDKTLDKLEDRKIKEKIEYGIINYNGTPTLEAGGSILEYMCFEPPFKGDYASYDDDYSQLMYYTDSSRKVVKICWYYYPEIS
ncbi:MAG: hypothetical protein PUE71_06075 [Clostridia bacterium]|nr:hypothetical protein [Clostridia bacterium]